MSVAVSVAVAVAVAVGTAPNAVPLRVTDCDVVLPSSVTVNFPISVVPVALVSVVGLNVTETWQFPPAEIDAPHEFAITSNEGVALIEETSSAKMLGLVMVTVLAADTDPTCTLPNAIESGENVGFASIPVPVSATDWGLLRASSAIVKVPLRAPV